jgi:ubiquinone/menaquinone biosynthesis C-methylase UbiE
MYEASADSYSEMMDKEIELPIYKEMLGRLHENIRSIPGAILDTACGSGHMLALFQSYFDSSRSFIGMDISPNMVAISKKRIGKDCLVFVGDMRSLPDLKSATVAAVINFFAIHHLDLDGINQAMNEWSRVLVHNGRLILAAWEGSGAIDYGEESDIVALRYTKTELSDVAVRAGLYVTRCSVKPVEGFPMDAIYLECIKG